MMSTQTQSAAPEPDEPTAVASGASEPTVHAVEPEASRAIIAEFFRAGDKDYEPQDFIQAVREQTRGARADTLAAINAPRDAWCDLGRHNVQPARHVHNNFQRRSIDDAVYSWGLTDGSTVSDRRLVGTGRFGQVMALANRWGGRGRG